MVDPLLLLFVAIAGGVGSVLRLLLGQWKGKLPWGTLAANSLAGLVTSLYWINVSQMDKWFFGIVFIGLCGGLSTFSGVAAETGELLKSKQFGRASAYLVLNFVAPLALSLLPAIIFINLVN